LKDATEFAVYSPNDQRLWEQIAFRCGNVLNEFWKAGGLKGRNPGQAYYVLCNETNNTVETISNGEVRVEVGVALQYPAEFVVITISQWTGGANSVSSL
jgi:phage tail sheath protein FI